VIVPQPLESPSVSGDDINDSIYSEFRLGGVVASPHCRNIETRNHIGNSITNFSPDIFPVHAELFRQDGLTVGDIHNLSFDKENHPRDL
jgi:hypothetical protein